MKFRLIALAAATALTLGACATTGPGGYYGTNPPPMSSGTCYDCGTVTRIDMAGGAGYGSTMPNATGAVVGGLVGAVAGREIAKDNTHDQSRRNVATVAGAAAGAAIGNAIQNRSQANNGTYNVTVRMNDGRMVTVTQGDLGGIREGSYVRVYNGRAWAQ